MRRKDANMYKLRVNKGIVAHMAEAQRLRNFIASEYINEIPYIEAFNIFYNGWKFKYIPKWLQNRLKPMAYKCFRAGAN